MTDIATGAHLRAPEASARPQRSPRESWRADSRFYLTMAIISSAIIFVGFAPSFYLKPLLKAPPPLSALTMTHGLVFTAWMALFITQIAFIDAGKPARHRKLGMLGVILFGVMIPLGFSVAITAGRLGHAPPGAPPPLAFMALPLFALIAVIVLVAGAIYQCRNPAWHKRLMLASFLIMTGPGTGRLAVPLGIAEQGPWFSMIIMEALLGAAMIHDRRAHGRVHPAYQISAVLYAIMHVALIWAFESQVWLGFARVITQG